MNLLDFLYYIDSNIMRHCVKCGTKTTQIVFIYNAQKKLTRLKIKLKRKHTKQKKHTKPNQKNTKIANQEEYFSNTFL